MSEPADNAALINGARAGDRRAFAKLVEPYRDRLWGVCVRITRNHADAEDALQECLIAAWQNLGKFRGESAFSTWMYRIAANAALALIRRRRDLSADGFELEDDGRDFTDSIADRDLVQAALRTVQPDFRVALVLREYGQLTYEEIAEHQGILVATVKTRINRARTALAAALTAERLMGAPAGSTLAPGARSPDPTSRVVPTLLAPPMASRPDVKRRRF